MKPLNKLMNVEKARLLHGLFPDEIPALLQFVKAMSATIREYEVLQKKELNMVFPDLDVSLVVVNEVATKIDRYSDRLYKHSGLFADQLFDGNAALYTIWCIKIYITVQKHENEKFVQAIRLLFN